MGSSWDIGDSSLLPEHVTHSPTGRTQEQATDIRLSDLHLYHPLDKRHITCGSEVDRAACSQRIGRWFEPLGPHITMGIFLLLDASIRFVFGVCNPFPPVTRKRPVESAQSAYPTKCPSVTRPIARSSTWSETRQAEPGAALTRPRRPSLWCLHDLALDPPAETTQWAGPQPVQFVGTTHPPPNRRGWADGTHKNRDNPVETTGLSQ